MKGLALWFKSFITYFSLTIWEASYLDFIRCFLIIFRANWASDYLSWTKKISPKFPYPIGCIISNSHLSSIGVSFSVTAFASNGVGDFSSCSYVILGLLLSMSYTFWLRLECSVLVLRLYCLSRLLCKVTVLDTFMVPFLPYGWSIYFAFKTRLKTSVC